MPSRDVRPLILLASANDHSPTGAYLAGLAEEMRGIRAALREGQQAARWEVEPHTNVTLPDLLPLLRDPAQAHRLAIFHFAGHARADALALETGAGDPAAAHAGGLAALLGSLPHLRLVFLNGCETRGLAEALVEAGVPAVIATDARIADSVAVEFAVNVYRALVDGRTIRDALLHAEGAARTRLGDDPRAAYRDVVDDDVAAERWPWALQPDGAEHLARWTLADIVGDPRVGLPPLRPTALPEQPYRHLRPFTRADAAVFFGRARELRELYDVVTDPDGAPVVLLCGAAGAGKSSLLDAGLLPRLEGRRAIRYARRDPALGLGGTLRRALAIDDTDPTPTASGLVVVLDQAEEAFTRPTGDPRAELAGLAADLSFLQAPGAAVGGDQRPRSKVLLSFRKEWLAEFQAALKAQGVWFTPHLLDRLDGPAVVEAIRGPADEPRLARHYHLEVRPGVAEGIARDLLADPDAPVAPTLQVLLSKMWDAAPVTDGLRRVFDDAVYQRLRREGILLADFLDQQLAALAAWHPELVRSGLALDVLHAHTTSHGTARAIAPDEVALQYAHAGESLLPLMQRCIDLYLLVGAEPTAAPSLLPIGLTATRLAHDTLAPLVRQRFEASESPGQRARRVVEHRAREWRDGRAGPLLDRADLDAVNAGLRGMRALTPDELRLVRTSERRQRAETVLRRASRTPNAAEAARLLVTLAGEPEPVGGAALAASVAGRLSAGLARDGGVTRASRDVVGPEPVVLRSESAVRHAEFNPDGTAILATWEDGTACVWPLDGRTPAVTLRHVGRLQSATFGPGGNRILIISEDGTVAVHAADGSGEPVVLPGSGRLRSAAFSPDGARIVTVSHEGVQLAAADGTGELVVLRCEQPIEHAIFSPDGTRVLATAWDFSIRVWRADGSGEPLVFRHRSWVQSVGFSPAGDRVLAAERDGAVHVWPAAGSGPPVELRSPGRLEGASFSPDGARVLTHSDDGVVRVWPADGSGDPVVLQHGAAVTGAHFSPDGTHVLTTSQDGVARVWGADGVGEPIVLRHRDHIERAGFSHDGTRVLAVERDGTACVWPADGLGEPVVLASAGHLRSASFAPGSARVVTAADDGAARVWRAEWRALIDFLSAIVRDVDPGAPARRPDEPLP